MDRSGHVAEALRRLQGGPGGPSSALPAPAPGLHSAGCFAPGSGPSAAPPSPGWLGDVVSFVPLGLTRGWEQPLGHKPRFCTYRPPAPATPGSSLAEERPAAWMAPWRGLPAGLTQVRDRERCPSRTCSHGGWLFPRCTPIGGCSPRGTHIPTGGLFPKAPPQVGCPPRGTHIHTGGCPLRGTHIPMGGCPSRGTHGPTAGSPLTSE